MWEDCVSLSPVFVSIISPGAQFPAEAEGGNRSGEQGEEAEELEAAEQEPQHSHPGDDQLAGGDAC